MTVKQERMIVERRRRCEERNYTIVSLTQPRALRSPLRPAEGKHHEQRHFLRL